MPTSRRNAVTHDARRTESHRASIIDLLRMLPGRPEPVFREHLPARPLDHELYELPGRPVVPRALQDYHALFDRSIQPRRNLPVLSLPQARRKSERLREDAGLRIARLHELRGLRYVLTVNQLGLHLLI